MVVLLTAAGKVEAAATQARASKRRFAGGVAAGMRGEATLARGRGALLRLGAFEAAAGHGAIGQDLTRFAYVAYVCELTDELVLPRQEDPRLYAELTATLASLCAGEPIAAELRRYELALLDCLGLLPALDRCCVCGEALAGAAIAFDGGRGGGLCVTHRGGAQRLSSEVLALAGALLHGGGVEVAAAAPTPLRRALRDLCVGLLRPHLRRPLRSQAFLAQIPRVFASEAG